MLTEVTFGTAKAAAGRVSRVVQEWLPGEMFLQIRTGLWNKGSLQHKGQAMQRHGNMKVQWSIGVAQK